MPDLNPEQWFDQFARLEHDPRMDSHDQWCWRHWAPCPVMHANGIQAAAMVMDEFLHRVLVPAGIGPRDFAAANAKLAEVGRLCCWLGDEEMHRIWGKCPPAGGPLSQGPN